MLSGALLLNPVRSESPSIFYHKRLMRIGVPLVFWSAFFMWFSVCFTHWVTPRQVWINLLKGQPYAHMHFIFRIAGLYAFTPMMRVFLRHATRSMQVATVATLLAMAGADSVANGITQTELSAFARFAPFVGYYLAGHLLRETLVSGRTLAWCWLGLIATIAILAGGTGALVTRFGMKWYPSPSMLLYDFLSPVRIVMALCAWLILLNLFHKQWPNSAGGQALVRKWANTTLGLYLIHPLFRELLYMHGISATWPNVWVGVPLVATMVYVPALLSTIVLMRIPYVRRIAG
jgi:surface polysaccharide O-acyltransferase-like enzyme